MTEDLPLRLEQHNNKLLSLWTKRGSEWQLVYKEEYQSKTEALNREKWFKTGIGREFIKKL